jgi:hypothetical protein
MILSTEEVSLKNQLEKETGLWLQDEWITHAQKKNVIVTGMQRYNPFVLSPSCVCVCVCVCVCERERDHKPKSDHSSGMFWKPVLFKSHHFQLGINRETYFTSSQPFFF